MPSVNYFFSVIPIFAEGSRFATQYEYSMSSASFSVSTLSPQLLSVLSDNLLTKSKGGSPTECSTAELLGNSKIVGVYFSGHWCGPCRQFTPQLAQMYLQAKKENLPFEVIFCSSDHDEDEFKSYYQESMPWLAIPYQDSKREDLQGRHQVNGIPRLIIFDAATGDIIENQARAGGVDLVRSWLQRTSKL